MLTARTLPRSPTGSRTPGVGVRAPVVAILLLLWSAALMAQAGPTARARGETVLHDWLRGTGIAPSDVGLAAMPVGDGAPLISHDAGQPLNPASTMKILTTMAALSILGPDYRWRTVAALRGRLEGDVLHGDLVLRGGGDPKLVVEDLTAFVARMRETGLREIRGDLVVDDGLFDIGPDSVERFDRDLTQPYNVRPHPLLMNFKAVRLLVPADGGPVRTDPPLADVPIEDAVRRLSGGCRPTTGLSVSDSGPGQAPALRVRGTHVPACGEQAGFVSVLSHRQFIHGLFKAAWLAAGGSWAGQTRLEAGASRGLTAWVEWMSPRTLADVVRDVNKFSNNVMSRQLFLMLAPEVGQQPVSLQRARDVVRQWLAAQGLDLPGTVIDNGSGLSREERLSASSLVALLRFASGMPHADLLRESLPLVGVDGTMRRRLGGEPVAARAWIKTGSLADVRSIAGYVDAASGRRYAIALLVNGPRMDGARLLQDRFLRWVHENG